MQKILKIRLDKTTLEKATKKAIEFAESETQHQISTPNAEILLQAQSNNKFLKALNQSHLNIPDGISLLWASKYLKISKESYNGLKIFQWIYSLLSIAIYPKFIKTELEERVTGVDLMRSIAKSASTKRHLRIFLLGGNQGIAEITRDNLEKEYPGINIVGTHSGSPDENKSSTELIKKSNANILFVAYGAPHQELWIARNLKNMPKVKVAMGVGGSFNFIAKAKKRAPKVMQKLGLEWVYRLIQEPSRIKRIFNATIKFPVTVLKRSLD